MIVWLMACAPAWTLEPGAFEDVYGHPREQLAGCTAEVEMDGQPVSRLDYDELGYEAAQELWLEDAWQPWWSAEVELDELDRPVRVEWIYEEGSVVTSTDWQPESWRRSSETQLVDYLDEEREDEQVDYSFEWTEGGYTQTAETHEYVVELAEGTRAAVSTYTDFEIEGHVVVHQLEWRGDRKTWEEQVDRPFWIQRSYDDEGFLVEHLDFEGTLNLVTWSCP